MNTTEKRKRRNINLCFSYGEGDLRSLLKAEITVRMQILITKRTTTQQLPNLTLTNIRTPPNNLLFAINHTTKVVRVLAISSCSCYFIDP